MKRILVVDDIEENLYLLRILLEAHGYETDQAVNGREALNRASEKTPDMIISDILMPVMDGFTLCREWKNHERLKHVPFIFYTATYTDPRDEQLALDMGADAFIVKPAEPDEFMYKIETVLNSVSEQKAVSEKIKPADETVLKKYNEALIRKLEHKMFELEKLNRELEAEITEKNRIESSLRKSEELFRNLFHQHAAVKLIIDSDTGRIVDANESAAHFYGWSRGELLSMNIKDINMLPADEVEAAIKMVLNQKRYHFEFRHRMSDGSARDVEVFSSKIHFQDKDLLHSVIHDITDRKMAEDALRRSEERFRRLHESMMDAFVQVDMDGKIVSWNRAYLEMLGFSADEIVNLSYVDLTPEKWHDYEMDIVKSQIMPLGYSEVYEKEYRRKDGTVFPVEMRTFLLKDSDCRPLGMWAIVRDITKRKKDERELILRSTALYNAGNAIIITDDDGIILYANPAFENLTGLAQEEAIGTNSRDLLKSEYHDRYFYKNLWSKITSGHIWNGEVISRKKDGSLFTEEITIAPVTNEKGKIVNYVAVIQDITDKKFASDLLKTRLNLISYSDSHSLDELMVQALDEVEKFTSSTVSFFHFVLEDQKTLTLQAWSTRTSLEYCKAEGKGLHSDIEKAGVWVDCVRERRTIVHNDYASLPHRKGLPEGHAPLIRELVIPIMRNNSIRAILGVGNKAGDYNDRDISVTSYLADILWDIIERKRADENLKRLNAQLETRVARRTAELERANKELESFSYSVSHDLRAPLRHITGFLEMLKRETGDTAGDRVKHYIEVIMDSSKRMGLLIDDLLSFSRMRRTSLSRQIINMEDLVSDILNEFSEEINRYKISISRKELPQVQGDTAMLRVVLVNLISNAIKFSAKSPDPVIEIGSDLINGETVFYVRDNGVGFDMKYAGKLFGVFQRLHNERDFEGTGIGLAIVKNIIERHNGRIWAESEPGKETCFYFILPGDVNVKTAE
jgi:PAS domain S-box-containing protein